MKAALLALAMAVAQVLPYAYCFALGMVVQFVGGAK